MGKVRDSLRGRSWGGDHKELCDEWRREEHNAEAGEGRSDAFVGDGRRGFLEEEGGKRGDDARELCEASGGRSAKVGARGGRRDEVDQLVLNEGRRQRS
jgi:hypothetical protein